MYITPASQPPINTMSNPMSDIFSDVWNSVAKGGDPIDNAKQKLMSGVGEFTDELVQKNLPQIKEACKGGAQMGIKEYGWQVWAMGVSFVGVSVGLGFWLGTLAKKNTRSNNG